MVLATALSAALWRTPVATLPAVPLVLAGVLALAVALMTSRGDRIVDPRTGRERLPDTRLSSVVLWTSPLLLVALVVLFWLSAGES